MSHDARIAGNEKNSIEILFTAFGVDYSLWLGVMIFKFEKGCWEVETPSINMLGWFGKREQCEVHGLAALDRATKRNPQGEPGGLNRMRRGHSRKKCQRA
ncbi:MAG: hypothetical protein A2Y07_03810 [Planctomycetes bacterium GWF2_50_10]|nr:MAG: hypothetical protein A2Y07_03810 [Planctomycetes bacterium GWF2_50_10]